MNKVFIKPLQIIFLFFVGLNAHAQKQLVVDPDAVVRELLGSFSSIKVSSGIHVFLSQAEAEMLAISSSEEKYRQGIKTEISNGELHIFYMGDKIRFGNNFKMNVYVGYKNLEQLHASGVSNIIIAGVMELPLLNVQLTGASQLKGQLKISDLNIKLSGASEAKILGSVKNINIESSGASDVKAFGLSAENCNVKASGASDVKITVTKYIAASASGASNIFYKGSAELTLKQSSGASSVSSVE